MLMSVSEVGESGWVGEWVSECARTRVCVCVSQSESTRIGKRWKTLKKVEILRLTKPQVLWQTTGSGAPAGCYWWWPHYGSSPNGELSYHRSPFRLIRFRKGVSDRFLCNVDRPLRSSLMMHKCFSDWLYKQYVLQTYKRSFQIVKWYVTSLVHRFDCVHLDKSCLRNIRHLYRKFSHMGPRTRTQCSVASSILFYSSSNVQRRKLHQLPR